MAHISFRFTEAFRCEGSSYTPITIDVDAYTKELGKIFEEKSSKGPAYYIDKRLAVHKTPLKTIVSCALKATTGYGLSSRAPEKGFCILNESQLYRTLYSIAQNHPKRDAYEKVLAEASRRASEAMRVRNRSWR